MFDNFSAQLFNLLYFPVLFFLNIGKLTNLIFLVLENFTTSDRTPPYMDTYLRLFPNFGKFGNTLSDKNEPDSFEVLPSTSF